MSIKKAIFAVESMAHLQGKERELLPIVEAARKEHAALLEAVARLEAMQQLLGEFGSTMPCFAPEFEKNKHALEKLQ